jgi:hypothetical protein
MDFKFMKKIAIRSVIFFSSNIAAYFSRAIEDCDQIHLLLQKIQQAGGDREELKKIKQGSLYGDFIDDFPIDTFIGISSDGEQASIILNIGNPDTVIAFSHCGDTIGGGYDAETISLKDFLFLIESCMKEDNFRKKQGDKYINPQNRSDFVEYNVEVTKTTLAELLEKIKLSNNSNR